jgi:hypothetical protein
MEGILEKNQCIFYVETYDFISRILWVGLRIRPGAGFAFNSTDAWIQRQ